MANPFDVQVPNILQAILSFDQARQNAEMDRARNAAFPDIASGNTNSALANLIKGGDVKSAGVLANYANAANSVYGTPIYGTGPSGETRLGTFDKQGRFRPIDTGAFTPTPGIRTIDTGTGTAVVSSKTGAPIGSPMAPGQTPVQGQPSGFVPKDLAGKEEQEAYGKDIGNRRANLGQAQNSFESSITGLNRLASQANEVMNHRGLPHILGLWGVLPNIPGGEAADAQAKLDALKSQVGFTVLQAMRDASKTGGALGQVSDFENKLLQNNLAELDRAQSVPQFKTALKKIIDYANGAKDRITEAYQKDYSALSKPTPQQSVFQPGNRPGTGTRPISSRQEYDALPSGTQFTAPDGSVRVKP